MASRAGELRSCGTTTRWFDTSFLAREGALSCGVLDTAALPETAEELRRLVLEQRAALAERDGTIERLKAQLAWLRRQQFGRSSEKIEREIAQLELQLEGIEESSSARRAIGGGPLRTIGWLEIGRSSASFRARGVGSSLRRASPSGA